MTSDNAAALRAVIAQEQRTIRRYSWLLLFGWLASERQRTRWEAQRAYHQAQIKRRREELQT